MLKKMISGLILAIGVFILAGPATAAKVEIDLLSVFDDEGDRIVRFGDNDVDHENLFTDKSIDFDSSDPIARQFQTGGTPTGTLTFEMTYFDVDYTNESGFFWHSQGSFLSVNGVTEDLVPSSKKGNILTWTADADILKSEGEWNDITFFIGYRWGFLSGTDIDDFEVSAFTLSWETETNTGGADPVPIPTAAVLLGCGLIGVVGIRRRRE
ncbi:MAG: hypothetical protein HUN04_12880 [Desulfobacter sp.]|nr:MAG: hypothetical protein HUN04_12880 [Desulfobacter sp.]